MTTQLATGISKGKNGTAAARGAVLQAKKKLGPDHRIDLSMVYSSSEYGYKAVVDAVRAATNEAPLIGASSAGEFTEEKVEKGSVAVGLLSTDEIKIFSALAEGVSQNPEAAIKEVLTKLPKTVAGHPYLTAILQIDGLSGLGEEVVLLTSYLIEKQVNIVGGMAGDDFKMEQTFVFCDHQVCTDAISICLLASKMPLFTGVKHGHKPLSGAFKATKVKGNVLYEVNDRPAWDIWKQETAQAARNRGIDVEQIKTTPEFARFSANYMFGLATEKGGEYKLRWPVSVNEDGSINLSCGITEGAVFRIMDGSNLENQIDAAEEAATIVRESAENTGFSDFSGIIVFECAVRQLMLGDRFSESVERIKNVLPGVPILGWETYGEIRLEPGQFSGFHNTTSVVLLLPKCEKKAWG